MSRQPLPALRRATASLPMAAALGSGWTVVLAEDGALYACGSGDSGQLGINARTDELQLVRVSGAEPHGNSPVVLVAAGELHWAAVLEDGAVLTCGRGSKASWGTAIVTSCGRRGWSGRCLGGRPSCSWPADAFTRWR